MSLRIHTNRQNGQPPTLRLGLSSYRATFQHHINMLSRSESLSDDKWLTLLSNLLKVWFVNEAVIIDSKEGENLVDILRSRGLL